MNPVAHGDSGDRVLAFFGNLSAVHQWSAPLFVAGTWLALSLASAWVGLRGLRFPFTDDWPYMPFATGEKAVTLRWLWTPHNEHVAPLPKLVFLAVNTRFTGYDLRAGILFDVAVLSVLALAMIFIARAQRGWTSYSDAFFALALLHWGRGVIWWGFYIHFVSATILAGILLALVVQQGSDLTRRGAILGGLCVVLLPLCGAYGVALAPALAAWLAYGGWRQWGRRGRDPFNSAVLSALPVLVALLLVSVSVAYIKPVKGGALVSRDIGMTLDVAVKWTSMGLWSTLAARSPPLAPLIPLFLTATVICLVTAWFRAREQRPRVAAFGFYIGAFASLALAVGWGRAGLGWNGSSDAHYGILSVPLFCCAYFVWGAFASRNVARFVQMTLFALMLSAFWTQASGIVRWRAGSVTMQETFERDLRAGDSPCVLAERHLSLFWYRDNREYGRKIVVAGLRQLQRAGVAPFRSLQDDLSKCPL